MQARGVEGEQGVQDEDDENVPLVTARVTHPTVGWGTKLLYACPAFAGLPLHIPITMLLNKFYSDTLLVKLSHLAFSIAVARSIDAVFDPLLGWISDNTTWMVGRRRPFIFIGSLACAAIYWLLFSPPESLMRLDAALWYGVWFTIFLMAYSTFMTPYNALGVELTLDYHDRTRLFAWKAGFGLVGTLFAAVVPGILIEELHERRRVLTVVGIVFAFLVSVTFPIMAFFVVERRGFYAGNPIVPGFNRCLHNKSFIILLVVYLCSAVPAYSVSTLFPFYNGYVIVPEEEDLWLSVFLGIFIGTSVLSVPLWLMASLRVGKKNAYMTAWVLICVALVAIFFLGRGDVIALCFLVAALGVGSGAVGLLNPSLEGDVIDFDEFYTGKRREGQYLTFWTVLPRLMAVPSTALPLSIVGTMQYRPNEPQDDGVILTIRLLFSLIPAFFSCVALGVIFFYPITPRVHRALRRGIDAHWRGERCADPLHPELLVPPPGKGELTEEEEWFLFNFFHSELRSMARKGPKGIVFRVCLHVIAWNIVWVAVFAGLFVSMFSVEKDAGLLEVSLLCLATFSFAGWIFNCMRLGAAREMERNPLPQQTIQLFTEALNQHWAAGFTIPETERTERTD